MVLSALLLGMALMRDCSQRKEHMGDLSMSTLSVRTFGNLHHTGRHWSNREAWFVDHIPDDSRVVDLGAGAMHLNVSLNRARRGIHYVPVDAHDRGVPAMRVCMLNKWEYPISLTPQPTVIVMQGVLEYITDKAHFLGAFRCAYPSATILLSYTAGHAVAEREQQQGWVAPLTLKQLKEVFDTLHLDVTKHTPGCLDPSLTSQDCFKIISRDQGSAGRHLCNGLKHGP